MKYKTPLCRMALRRAVVQIIRLSHFICAALVLYGTPASAKDLPGATQTSYGVSATGAFQFQIPIVIPAGTNGMQPNLSLSFSSGGGNGMAGVGWGVSGLSSIQRCPRTFASNNIAMGPTHREDDRFCLNGKILALASHTWQYYGDPDTEYRTEVEEFSKVVANGSGSANVNGGTAPTSFTVHRKDGLIMKYGSNTSSRFTLPGTNSIHAWMLSKVMDRSGNYYEVVYRTSDGLPNHIDYTKNSGLTADKQVDFIYETRPDVRTRYIAGKKITYSQRLKTLRVKKNTTTLREYQLAYETAPISKRSRLTSVTECGLNNACMPPIQIAWQAEQSGFTPGTVSGDKAPYHHLWHYTYQKHNGDGTSEQQVKEIDRGGWVDVNGDGELDLVIAYTTPGGENVLKTFIKTPAGGWHNDSSWALPYPLRSYDNAVTNMTTNRLQSTVINYGQLVDVNGDGLVDVVYSYKLDREKHQYADTSPGSISEIEEKRETWINTGNGWQKQNTWAPKDLLFDYLTNSSGYIHVETVRGRLIDLNGDGLPDWVRAYYQYTSGGNGIEHKKTWINNGNGWNYDSSYNLPDVFVKYRGELTLPRGEFVDVNGDGLVDWVQAYWESGFASYTGNTWLNTGSGWQLNNTYKLPEPIYDNHYGWDDNAAHKRGSFVDVNGDGLRDWVRSYKSSVNSDHRGVQLNTGKGWQWNGGYQPPFVHMDHTFANFAQNWPVNIRGVYVDLNRDGLVDYLQSYRDTNSVVHKAAWRNTGTGWSQDNALSHQLLMYDYSGQKQAKINYGRMIDINSDGSPDWVRSRTGLNNVSRLMQVGKVDLLASVTTTMDVAIKPTFLPLTDNPKLYTKGTGAAETNSFHFEAPVYVTSKLETRRADAWGYNTTEYRYSGAQMHRRGRGFLGFKTVETKDINRNITQTRMFHQDFPLIGRVSDITVKQGATTLRATTNTHNWRSILSANGYGKKFAYLEKSETTTHELSDGLPYRWSKQEMTFDDWGNLTERYTQVGSSSAPADLKSEVWETPTYEPADTTNWLIGQVKDQTETYAAPNRTTKVRFTQFEYDSLGRIEYVTREPNTADPNIKLVTTYVYDAFGNIVQGKVGESKNDSNARTNLITYDLNQHRLPVSLTNAEGHVSSITYHPQCDVPSTVTDPNDLDTNFVYDDYCRETSVTAPSGVESTTAYTTANLACVDCQTTPKLKITTQNDGEPAVVTYFNRYTQPLVSSTQGMLLETIKQRTEYDRFGRVSRKSLPYFSTDVTQYWTDYAYDKLNRTTEVTLPFDDATNQQAKINYSFGVNNLDQLVRYTLDPKGRTTTAVVNALNQIVAVYDFDSEAMTYAFDAQGNLIQTTDAQSNSIHVEYDLLGRRTKLVDPDLGTSEFTYNAYSELTEQKDNKQQVITMTYDKLSRLLIRTVPGTTSEGGGVSIWAYDIAAKGKGAIASITGPSDYAKSFTYDQYGRPDSDTTTIRGDTFTQSYTYNTDGFLASRRYPDSGTDKVFEVNFAYVNGYLSTVTGTGNTEYWRADKYDALGRTQQDTLGNLVTTTRTFDAAQGVLKKIESILNHGSQATVQDLNYTYDEVNNLKTRSDALTSVSENFDYDNLDRLISHTRTKPGETNRVTTVEYDKIGNITYKSDVGTYSYGGTRPHAVTQVNLQDPIGNAITLALSHFEVNWEWDGQSVLKSMPSIHGQTFTYDGNGNITQSGDRYVWWTAFDKPYRVERVDSGLNITTGANFEYDAGFNRIVKQEDSGETTIYIGKDYERITHNGATKHRYTITTGSHAVQIERTDGTDVDQPKYLLGDNLGSTNVILDAQGNVAQTLEFDPWGMRTDTGDTTGVNSITNRGYTGHEMDDDVGLVNMNARIYDPYLGRFLSADPVLPNPYDMQQFNRYSYVVNNPLKYVDPTGNYPSPEFSPETVDVNVIGDPSSGAVPVVMVTTEQVVVTRFTFNYDGIELFYDLEGKLLGASFGDGVSYESRHRTILITHVTVDYTDSGESVGENLPDRSQSQQEETPSDTLEDTTLGESSAPSLSKDILKHPNRRADNPSSEPYPPLDVDAKPQEFGVSPLLGGLGKGFSRWSLRKLSDLKKWLKNRKKKKSKDNDLTIQQQRSIRSLERRIQEHLEKLEEFKRNPTIRPGMENMSQEAIRQQQIIRIRKLEKEIQTFRDNIEKIKKGKL